MIPKSLRPRGATTIQRLSPGVCTAPRFATGAANVPLVFKTQDVTSGQAVRYLINITSFCASL